VQELFVELNDLNGIKVGDRMHLHNYCGTDVNLIDEISLEYLPNGVYFLKATDGVREKRIKLIKSH
jgi:hypothetical protein